MFPIPPERFLSIAEIADFWSREISPSASKKELREEMVKAWWRGELPVTDSPDRIDVLRGLYATRGHDQIIFTTPGVDTLSELTRLDDGSVLVDTTSVRVPLPSERPESWTEESCAKAVEAIADSWDETIFHLFAPGLVGLSLNVDQFMTWVDQREFPRPKFWRIGPRGGGSQPTATRHLSPKTAQTFVNDYIAGEKKEQRRPSMTGLEKAAQAKGIVGHRDLLRETYRAEVGVEIRRGRPRNSPAEK